jgi:ribosomal protein S27AE
MNWEQRFCPNQSCTVDFWMVQHAADDHELWHVIDNFDGGAFTVAAVDPVCPRCGTTLCLTTSLAHQDSANLLEAEPQLEFIRNLSGS